VVDGSSVHAILNETRDEALIALFIGGMNANDHVAPRRSCAADMRSFVGASDAGLVVTRAAKAIPARLGVKNQL
jgi:hypothetical protein